MYWLNLDGSAEIASLMEQFGSFHDSCIKEARYVSGAYVNTDYSMLAENGRRDLCLLFQRQESGPEAIELVFTGVRSFHLEPATPEFTCEIMEAYFRWEEDLIWWSDWPDFDPAQPRLGENYTWVCAEGARWRSVDGWLGGGEIYAPNRAADDS